ncbi:MAG: hypothetical protein V4719_20695 [Planctomycetota bacterium]
MPRKLLRVALVAAVLPAMTPEISMAQTAKVGSTVRTAAPAPMQKKGITGWWQRVRGQKPETAQTMGSAKVVRVSAEMPTQTSPTASGEAFNLEGNSDMQMLRRDSGRRRPSVESTPASTAAPVEREITKSDRAAFENVFPDDAPAARRTRPVSKDVATPVEQEIATVAAPQDAANGFATPVSNEPEAYPIEAAAPPEDVTAAYNAPQGTVPQYMMTQGNDVSFANPIPARPAGQVMNGMNGGTPTYQAPPAMSGGNPGYYRMDGAMYPGPQPGIPYHVGSTVITNPALDPHEMLYAHRYRGLYGPFYHKTCRTWVLTPFGICKNEKRTLVGTEVRVNYKSHISPFALFWAPVSY